MVAITLTKGGYVEMAGLSTDTKPTANIATGSIFVEVDTGYVFFFDSASTTWVEQFSFQGSSGGAKSAPVLTKNAVIQPEEPEQEQEDNSGAEER